MNVLPILSTTEKGKNTVVNFGLGWVTGRTFVPLHHSFCPGKSILAFG